MARVFGGFSGGGGNKGLGGSGKKDARSSADRMMMTGKQAANKGKMSADEQYQALMQKKMESAKKNLMAEKKYGFQPPGTKQVEKKELSKGAMQAMQMMAERMAKNEMKMMEKKKKKSEIEIIPGYVGGMNGGFLDKKGGIWRNNEKLLQVDIKTGALKTGGWFGRKIGKYAQNSPGFNNKVANYIAQVEAKRAKEAEQKNSGGSIWGPSSDDNNKGWW